MALLENEFIRFASQPILRWAGRGWFSVDWGRKSGDVSLCIPWRDKNFQKETGNSELSVFHLFLTVWPSAQRPPPRHQSWVCHWACLPHMEGFKSRPVFLLTAEHLHWMCYAVSSGCLYTQPSCQPKRCWIQNNHRTSFVPDSPLFSSCTSSVTWLCLLV